MHAQVEFLLSAKHKTDEKLETEKLRRFVSLSAKTDQ